MKHFKPVSSLLALVIFFSCNPQKNISGNYQFKTECLRTEGDGSQVVKAFGRGRNIFDAIEQAKKNALNDIIFAGINSPRTDCNQRPVLPEANAKQNNESYFFRFFSSDGEYSKFVSPSKTKIKDRLLPERYKAENEVVYAVVLKVDREALRSKFIFDKLISK
jgi:hypothetical protein